MIHNVNTILPCVLTYECRHDFEDLIERIEVESRKPWSHLPFTTGWTDEEGTTSEFLSIGRSHESEISSLRKIGDAARYCNDIIEGCLHDYITHYAVDASGDSGTFIYKITGENNYSTRLGPPDNFFVLTSIMALTEIKVNLERFETEFVVAPGDVYVVPAQFPHEHSILGIPDSAYMLGIHLRA